MLADVTGVMACPYCARPLVLGDGVVACDAGHRFDVAREGYVNLLGGSPQTGTADTPAMVAARGAFLAGGHFEPLAGSIAAGVARATSGIEGCILEVGAGTG